MSPQSFSRSEKRSIVRDLDRVSEQSLKAMREDFASLGEIEQTMLLDKLGPSGNGTREWWKQILMD